MLEAVTYQEMLKDIYKNEIKEDMVGILITRPDLEVGKSILESLNYYHHVTGKNINFYLPGYGAYWYETYPDGKVVSKINGTEWSYSDKMFVEFIDDLEKYSKWEYSGESELLMLEYKDGALCFEGMMRFYLDNMLRDNVIVSVSSFVQQLSRICKKDRAIEEISNAFGRNKLLQVTKETILEKLPSYFGNVVTQEKYFCVRNYSK
jgi:hypothetical protein